MDYRDSLRLQIHHPLETQTCYLICGPECETQHTRHVIQTVLPLTIRRFLIGFSSSLRGGGRAVTLETIWGRALQLQMTILARGGNLKSQLQSL